jgi:quinol monooxygenase YgiN
MISHFKVHEGKLDAFKEVSRQLCERTSGEPKCLSYEFSFAEHDAQCRESYEDVTGVFFHLQNSGLLLAKALTISYFDRFEVHCAALDFESLKLPLAQFRPKFFTREYSFRRNAL